MERQEILKWAKEFNIELNEGLSDEDFIKEFSDKADWNYVSMYQKLGEDFIREFKNKVNWYNVSIRQKFSDDSIREFKNEVNWTNISRNQKLSENFIREFADKVNWYNVSMYQKLSEDFIREFKNKVDWSNISKCQKLSEDFIREFADKVDWFKISRFQKLSNDFIKEFDLDTPENNWFYKSEEFKKDEIVKSGKYECYDDYFIAYKSIRSDRYSLFNFQFQYLNGQTYECHADHTSNENSFGLSVWTEDKARNYCGQLVVKCKVYYKDVARLVHGSDKVRCTRFEVLD